MPSYLLFAFAALANGVTTVIGAALALALILCSGLTIYDTLYIEAEAKEGWDTLQYRPDVIDDANAQLTPSELAAINEDYRGWLTLYDTNIDYPVMQGEDDLYYASHNIYKETSLTGAIYLAAANSPDLSDSYNLIYGHHMDSGAMFGDLDKFLDPEFFAANRRAVLVTDTAVYDLTVFALIQTDAYEKTIYEVSGREVAEVLAFAAEHALVYDSSIEVGDKILALSTCSSSATNGRLVLLAAMTERVGSLIPVEGSSEGETGDGAGLGASDAAVPATTGGSADSSKKGFSGLFSFLEPRANEGGEGNWALLNLVTMLLTVYFFVPLGDLKAKYTRRRMVKRVAEQLIAESEQAAEAEALEAEMLGMGMAELEAEDAAGVPEAFEAAEPAVSTQSAVPAAMPAATMTATAPAAPAPAAPATAAAADEETYAFMSASDTYLAPEVIDDITKLVKHVTRKFRAGIALELVIAVAAVLFFFWVTDFRQPMVIINRYTPILILMLTLCWLTDFKLIRFCVYRTPEQNGAAHA